MNLLILTLEKPHRLARGLAEKFVLAHDGAAGDECGAEYS